MSVSDEGGIRIRRNAAKWVPPVSVLIAYVLLVFLVSLFVKPIAGIPSAEYVELVVPSAITGLGFLAAVLLLYFCWKADQDAREKQRREQDIGNRQAKMGERMAQAITHLGEDRNFMQVSGLIELSGLLDEWWRIGKEMRGVVPSGNDSGIELMVQTRRQELVDLIFKHSLDFDSRLSAAEDHNSDDQYDESTDVDDSKRKEIVQRTRSQILRTHLSIMGVNSDGDVESLRHLNLDRAMLDSADMHGVHLEGAYLEDAELKRVYLEGAHLKRAYLNRAYMERADLEGADLEGAHLKHAYLEGAHLKHAYLESADLESAYLESADLEGAYLAGAYLKNAYLVRANLKHADLTGARMLREDREALEGMGADLSGVIVLDEG